MPAAFWTALPRQAVRCRLCAHFCHLDAGQRGRCGVRVNENGTLISLVEDVVTGVAMDPVEKKPLYHVLPGSLTFSVGSAGCNFSCRFCQNHHISRTPADSGQLPGQHASPAQLVEMAVAQGAASVAFTYNEPTVFLELLRPTAALAAERGLPSLLVTNGFMSQDCLRALGPLVRAANVDLKGFSEEFYARWCGGRLHVVLDNLRRMKACGWWLEITTLIIPGINDSRDELRQLARFICQELGPETPWHLSAFHGAYRMRMHPSTPPSLLESCRELGCTEGLRFVYVGNVPDTESRHTVCPHCGAVCIRRDGRRVQCLGTTAGQCPACGHALPGIWS